MPNIRRMTRTRTKSLLQQTQIQQYTRTYTIAYIVQTCIMEEKTRNRYVNIPQILDSQALAQRLFMHFGVLYCGKKGTEKTQQKSPQEYILDR